MSTQPSSLAPATTCSVCRGNKILGNPPRAQACPVCGGTGVTQKQPTRVPYDWVFPNAVLTALQVGIGVAPQFDADADFEWVETVSTQTGIYSVQLKDTSTGRLLSNNPVNSLNFAGTAQLPHVLIEPYIIPRAAAMQAIFNDLSNAGNTIQLTLKGYKLFTNPAQGSQGAIVQA
jgi:hypothetical protein